MIIVVGLVVMFGGSQVWDAVEDFFSDDPVIIGDADAAVIGGHLASEQDRAQGVHRPGHCGGPGHMLRDRYAWADEDHDLAWTVAAIRGLDAMSVLTVYAGTRFSELGELTFAEAMGDRNEHFDVHAVLQLMAHGQYVLAIEPNGWTGNIPEVARRASRGGGRFFSVYWSPSAFQVLQARDGQVTASFDPTFIGLPAGAGDLLPGWVGDDDFPVEHLRSSCLAAMEQQTGLAFDRAWLGRRLPTYRIPAADDMLENTRLP